jgi:hypothetical protein
MVTFHHAFATMVGLRILALASVIGIAIYVPRLAESFGFDKGIAFTLAILNPLTIYHLIASGHNDSLMLALLLAGLAATPPRVGWTQQPPAASQPTAEQPDADQPDSAAEEENEPQEHPLMHPNRDVDISYRMTPESGKPGTQRMRWLAAKALMRVDVPGGLYIIIDHRKNEMITVNPSLRTIVVSLNPPHGLFDPDESLRYEKIGTNSIAGVACTEWKRPDRTRDPDDFCVSDDGMLLQVKQDQAVLMRALHVKAHPLSPALFDLPKTYKIIQTPAAQPDLGSAAPDDAATG